MSYKEPLKAHSLDRNKQKIEGVVEAIFDLTSKVGNFQKKDQYYLQAQTGMQFSEKKGTFSISESG